jgi:hypothetical protein
MPELGNSKLSGLYGTYTEMVFDENGEPDYYQLTNEQSIYATTEVSFNNMIDMGGDNTDPDIDPKYKCKCEPCSNLISTGDYCDDCSKFIECEKCRKEICKTHQEHDCKGEIYVKFNNYPIEVSSNGGNDVSGETINKKIKLSRIYTRTLTNGDTIKIPDTERQYESGVFDVGGAKVKLTLNGMYVDYGDGGKTFWDWTLIISPAPNEGATKWIYGIDEFLSSTTDANPKGASGRGAMIEIV